MFGTRRISSEKYIGFGFDVTKTLNNTDKLNENQVRFKDKIYEITMYEKPGENNPTSNLNIANILLFHLEINVYISAGKRITKYKILGLL